MQFNRHQLEIIESLKKTCDEFIMRVDDDMMKAERDELENPKILRVFLLIILSWVNFINHLKIFAIGKNLDKFEKIYYQAAECYETDVEL